MPAFGGVRPWMSELYPTRVLGTVISMNYMAGRGIGSIGLFAVPLAMAAFVTTYGTA